MLCVPFPFSKEKHNNFWCHRVQRTEERLGWALRRVGGLDTVTEEPGKSSGMKKVGES
jgi:hypothetical protein